LNYLNIIKDLAVKTQQEPSGNLVAKWQIKKILFKTKSAKDIKSEA
jgi:hypothetical protein